ncbi:MAG: dephospho-CoA kinase [Bacteroidales bacterium]|nr:dephospho-CoA kinase [Bacteroidales bacterium]
MKTVLVTGPIGGGKSEFCRYVAAKGYPVYDCDSRCKALYASVPGLTQRVEEAIGAPFSRIGLIFSDARRREAVEALVYPELLQDFRAWRAALRADIVFVESAVALQKPLFDVRYDHVLLVSADYALRVARNPKAAQRDALQAFPAGRIDSVLENNGSLADFHARIDRWLEVFGQTIKIS